VVKSPVVAAPIISPACMKYCVPVALVGKTKVAVREVVASEPPLARAVTIGGAMGSATRVVN